MQQPAPALSLPFRLALRARRPPKDFDPAPHSTDVDVPTCLESGGSRRVKAATRGERLSMFLAFLDEDVITIAALGLCHKA